MGASRNVGRINTKAPPLDLPRLEYVFEQHRRRPTDPYWCLRVCEAVKPADGKRVAALWAAALARVVSYDPTWFVSLRLSDIGAMGMHDAPLSVLARVERQISIRDRSRDHHVKGLLWACALRFRKPPVVQRLRHAANHLVRVDERHRLGSFYEHLCHALEHVDYDELKTFFAPLLEVPPAKLGEGTPAASRLVEQGHLVFVLVAAARVGDWKTYETYRGRFRDGDDAHRDCQIWACDGLSELARERDEHLADILKSMTERAANVMFLGGQNDTAFIEALIQRGRYRDECRAYLEATRTGGSPATQPEHVAKLLARLASANE